MKEIKVANENSYADEYEVKFDTYDHAQSFLAEQQLTDVWLDINTDAYIVGCLDDDALALKWIEDKYADAAATKAIEKLHIEGATLDAVKDTMEHTKCVVAIGEKTYLLRDTALWGLISRAGQDCRATSKMYDKRRVDLFPEQINRGLGIMAENSKILFRNEKITAMNSSEYVVLPAGEMLTVLDGVLETRFPGAVYVNGYYNHSYVTLNWKLPQQAKELLECYTNSLKAAKNIAGSITKMVPAIRFSTSDNCGSAVTVDAKVSVTTSGGDSFDLEIGSAIKVDHRGANTSRATFEAACDGLYAAFCDQAKKVAELLEIKVQNPHKCIEAICRKGKLPTEAIAKAHGNYVAMSVNNEDNAHDVFWAICSAVGAFLSDKDAKGEEVGGEVRMRIDEAVSRILVIRASDWKEMDEKYSEKGEDEYAAMQQ